MTQSLCDSKLRPFYPFPHFYLTNTPTWWRQSCQLLHDSLIRWILGQMKVLGVASRDGKPPVPCSYIDLWPPHLMSAILHTLGLHPFLLLVVPSIIWRSVFGFHRTGTLTRIQSLVKVFIPQKPFHTLLCFSDAPESIFWDFYVIDQHKVGQTPTLWLTKELTKIKICKVLRLV